MTTREFPLLPREPAPRIRAALRHGAVAAALWLSSTAALCAVAAPVSSVPSRIELSANNRSVDLTLRNDGHEALIVRLQPMVWTPDPIMGRYEPTDDIASTPPAFALKPGATQQVHVELVRPRMDLGANYQLSWQAVAIGTAPRS